MASDSVTLQQNGLSPESQALLVNSAIEAKEFAYSPYSKFRVGCALLSQDGTIIKGANVENASYGKLPPDPANQFLRLFVPGGTICAERTAIVKAVSEGQKNFDALAVTSDVPSAISPCGMCRQVLREFCALDMPILLVPANYSATAASNEEGAIKSTTLGILLPDSFGPEHLELPRTSS